MPETNPWNDFTVGKLKFFWLEGKLSCAEIAKELGLEFSRNSVIGKANRLGLPPRKPRKDRSDAMPVEVRRSKQTQRQRERRARERQTRQELKKVVEMKATGAYPGSLDIPLLELRTFSKDGPNQCRFIAAEPPGPDYLHCGIETLAGYSYCPHHHKLTHRQYEVVAPSIQPKKVAA